MFKPAKKMDQQGCDLIERMFREKQPQLRAFLIHRLPTVSDAEDALQEVFYRLCRMDDLSRVVNPAAFLFSIAENIVRDFYRHARSIGVHSSLAEFVDDLPSREPSAARVVFGIEWLKAYNDAIERLPPRCRRVFVMCRVENRSHAQIAAELGVSIKMVEKYMTRALNELRASLASFLEGGVD